MSEALVVTIGGNYNTLKDSQRKELVQKGKKLLEVTQGTY
jgi:hypothetical protein